MHMAGVEIAEAYVTLLPSMRGMQKRIASEMGGIADQSSKHFSDRFSSGLKKWTKRGFLAVGGLIGGAITAGINRTMKIEDAEGKLRGLGHTGENIAKIMGNALDAVKGTAFGLDEAATVAASAVAAGVKPGKELAAYLTMVGDAATIAGTSMSEMGMILNKVQSQGRAYTQELNMLAERGIPIFEWLQKEYNVSADELRKMVASGKVDAETFYKVITENIGGAALESGNTTRGALANLRAAYARFGQALIATVFPLIKVGAGALTGWLDEVTAKVQAVNELLTTGEFSENIREKLGVEEDSPVVGVLLTIRERLIGIGKAAQSIPNLFAKAFEAAKLLLTGNFTESFGKAFSVEEDDPLVASILRIRSLLTDVGEGLGKVFGKVFDLGKALFNLFTGRGTGALAQFLDVKQDHPLVKFMLNIKRLATETLPAAFGRLAEALVGAFKILTGGPTGLFAKALGVDQGHFLVQGLVAIRDAAVAAFTWIRDVAFPIAYQIGVWIGEKMRAAFAAVAPWVEKFGDWLLEHKQHLPAIAAGLVAGYLAFSKWKTFSAIGGIVSNAFGLIRKAWTALSSAFLFNPVFLVIAGLTAGLILLWQNSEKFRDIVTSAFGKVGEVASSLWNDTLQPFLGGLWDDLVNKVIPAIGDFWNNSVKPVFTEIGNIIADAWDNKIGPALGDFWNMIQEHIIPALQNLWENVVKPVFGFIGETVRMAWENFIGPALTSLVDFIVNTVIPTVLWFWTNVIGPVFSKAANLIASVWQNIIMPTLTALRDFLFGVVAPVILWLWENVVKRAFEGIAAIIRWAWNNVIGPIFGWLANWISATLIPFLGNLWQTAQKVWNGISSALSWVWNTIILPIFRAVWGWIKDTLIPFLGRLWNTAEEVWDGIGGAIQWAWEKVISPAFDAIKQGAQWVADKFEDVVGFIGNAWEHIKSFLSKPIVAVIEFVNDHFIDGINTILGWVSDDLKIAHIPVPDFLKPGKVSVPRPRSAGTRRGGARSSVSKALGGILPGWSPGKDNYRFVGEKFDLWLAGGEAIMRPEWTKAVGADFVNRMNAIARTRGVQGVREAMGFADGGVFGGAGDRKGGGWWDTLVDIGKGVVDFLASPLKFLKDLFLRGIDALASNPFFEWLKGAAGKVAGIVKDKILSFFGLSGEADPNVPRRGRIPPGGMSSEAIYALAKSLDPTVVMTSGRRNRKYTRSGFVSYHYLGRAADLVSANMMRTFMLLRATGLPWSELYYSPAGNLQMRGGRPYNTYGTPAWADHFDHIHAAMARGGILPRLYDEGGYLPPGLTLVANNTGKPEPVLTEEQWERLAERNGMSLHFHNVPMDVSGETAAEVLYHLRRTDRGGKYQRRR